MSAETEPFLLLASERGDGEQATRGDGERGDGERGDGDQGDGERTAVLLLHGFTGVPREMRYLGEALHARGHTALGARLAGHDGTAEALEPSRWPDWLRSAEEGLAELVQRCGAPVHLAGFSLGGALSLLLAARHPERVRSLALLAAPLWLPFFYRWPVRLLARTGLHGFRKLVRGDLRDSLQRRAHVEAGAYPFAATLSLLELLEHEVRPVVERVQCPALILHSRRDHTVPFACSGELLRRLPRARRVTLTRSFHVLPLDVEREQVAAEVIRFYATVEEEADVEVRRLD